MQIDLDTGQRLAFRIDDPASHHEIDIPVPGCAAGVELRVVTAAVPSLRGAGVTQAGLTGFDSHRGRSIFLRSDRRRTVVSGGEPRPSDYAEQRHRGERQTCTGLSSA